ncbi:hypothetical protein BZA05DRAFT_387064 [Tricharina praecox]|uniref:uncharacterized protein n=1 Tax=Tricharina praecox TaxID=43433 RepID=UPI00221EA4FE|nr:uncharacterized protein BZA05DRAFT_387064 [Tricharina praecox]KAI5857037.1 hypothetical protein BZA05DRAFT_387064 [Tricharina praecox]
MSFISAVLGACFAVSQSVGRSVISSEANEREIKEPPLPPKNASPKKEQRGLQGEALPHNYSTYIGRVLYSVLSASQILLTLRTAPYRGRRMGVGVVWSSWIFTVPR